MDTTAAATLEIAALQSALADTKAQLARAESEESRLVNLINEFYVAARSGRGTMKKRSWWSRLWS